MAFPCVNMVVPHCLSTTFEWTVFNVSGIAVSYSHVPRLNMVCELSPDLLISAATKHPSSISFQTYRG